MHYISSVDINIKKLLFENEWLFIFGQAASSEATQRTGAEINDFCADGLARDT